MLTRRTLLTSAAGAGALAVAGLPRWPRARREPLRILILGGTGFLGPHVVEAARPRGHVLTLFNRGKTNPGLFPDIEQLHGDRDPDKGTGLEALKDRQWDAVLDNSGYVPRIVKASAELLAPHCKQYIFISSISVFADGSKRGMAEDGPLATMPDETSEKVMENYGALKALCERAAETELPGRVANVRPGLIVGPGDPTDRYTYWPVRAGRGGEVLAPGDGSDPVQYVDVRDLARWIVTLIEEQTTGVFNAVGPATPLTMKALLEACHAGCGKDGQPADATYTWVDATFLAAEGVQPWQDLPVWVPASSPDAGFAAIDCSKAIGKGLRFRPAVETAHDTLAWWAARPEDERTLKGGLTPEREAELLAKWKARPK